jgi:hypothetical protein
LLRDRLEICSGLIGHIAPRKGRSMAGSLGSGAILSRMGVDAQVSVLRVSGFIPDDPRGSAATAARALVSPPTRVVVCDWEGSGIGAVEAALPARAPNRLIARDPVRAAVIIRPLRKSSAGCGGFRSTAR